MRHSNRIYYVITWGGGVLPKSSPIAVGPSELSLSLPLPPSSFGRLLINLAYRSSSVTFCSPGGDKDQPSIYKYVHIYVQMKHMKKGQLNGDRDLTYVHGMRRIDNLKRKSREKKTIRLFDDDDLGIAHSHTLLFLPTWNTLYLGMYCSIYLPRNPCPGSVGTT